MLYNYRSVNPTSYYNGTRWIFQWKNGRELTTATDGTTNISYDYDANGLRTQKNVDGVIHTYYYGNDGKLLRETYDTHILDFFYNSDGTPHALRYNGTYFYYVTNLQGDVIRIVDADGETVCEYQYDPYGNILSKTATDVWIEISDAENDSTNIFEDLNDLLEDMENIDIPVDGEILELSVDLGEINPLRYRGYYYDTETELYYLQSRYYDPATGRFINADVFASTGQDFIGYNMFAYCSNNPINNSDPTGHFGLVGGIVAKVTVGAAINVFTTFVAAKVTGQNYSITDAKYAAISGAIGSFTPKAAKIMAGVVSGGYSAWSAYKNGANIGGAFIAGLVSGLGTTFAVSTIAGWYGCPLGSITASVVDTIFGTSANTMAAITYRLAVDSNQTDEQIYLAPPQKSGHTKQIAVRRDARYIM